jgi:hypothetical protein
LLVLPAARPMKLGKEILCLVVTEETVRTYDARNSLSTLAFADGVAQLGITATLYDSTDDKEFDQRVLWTLPKKTPRPGWKSLSFLRP